MQLVSLKTVFNRFFDAMNLRDTSASYVFSGMTPTPHGAGSLQVDVAAGVYARSSDNVRRAYAGGNIVLTAADAVNPRVDIVYISAGDALAKTDGVVQAANPVPAAWPAGSVPVAVCFVAPG